MTDYATAYADGRQRMTDLVKDLDEGAVATRIPTCPDWTVKDLVAHVTGIVSDMQAGKLEGVGSDAWTAAQVDARRASSLAEILEEWQQKGSTLEAMLPNLPPMVGSSLLGDLATHEHDLRGALGAPGARDAEATKVGLEFYVKGLGRRLKEQGLPAVRVRAGDQEMMAGEGDPAATVSAEPFELFRALTGRRSTDQIGAFTWDGDAGPYVGVFSAYGMPDTDVTE